MSIALNFRLHETEAPDPDVPLVIAHGLLGQGRNFGTLARGFGEKRNVISVDMRNHGDSPWDERMDYPAMAEDLARVIEENAGGRAHLLGHSMGGKAAMVTALNRPELVVSLTVADIAPIGYNHDYHKELAAMREMGLEGISKRTQADQILTSRIPQAAMRAFLLQNLSISDGAARWKPNIDVLDRSMKAITGWPELATGAHFDGPALFVRGADSTYVGEQNHATIKSLFPKAEFDSITGAGHWLHAERPKPFFESVEGFLSRNPG